MKIVPLSMGAIALVDDDDFAMVSALTWFACKTRDSIYAYSALPCGTKVSMSRLIMDAPRDKVVDHINGCTLDNRRENLRVCTHAENARNRRKGISRANKTAASGSIYKGVSYRPYEGKRGTTQKWCSYIMAGRDKRYLGSFKSEEEAARAYDTAAKQMHGPFARLNFPSDQQNTVPPEEKFFQEGTTKCGSSRSITGKSEAVK